MSASASARCPALLIAAPASGQGKTTVTAALARLHVRRGLEVRVFKCGPDFLDPHWHELASVAPVHQLDLWMTGQADCVRRLHAAAQEADLILIEGVMGLFDGDPSAADLAQRFGVPVLAVVDASAMAGTFGALAFGLQHYRPGLPWAGVLANRVGSARHAGMLQAGLREPQDWLGALMRVSSGTDMGTARTAGALLPERHLGLVAAHELRDSQQRLDAAADALAATPLGQMTAQDLQRWAVDFPAPAHTDAVPGLLAGRTVAVARDAAFCFIYTANVQCLTQMGARVVFFSPLHDAALPECDAVWLPGGYPELHTAPIAANTGMQASLRAHVAAGKPLWAECGGMMALFESITLADGSMAPLWGLLPGRVTMQKRLAALGPQQLDVAGHTLRGHTFHYSTSDSSATVVARTTRPDEAPAPDSGEVLYQQGSIHASYFHAWFPSSPEAVAHLLDAVPV
ncbi:cobyrinic acid a,c-diamide synthase [Acidovorax carolinensis]|uniref:Cobyrinic acid a,c-diamide synthase n=1 Tax=Acidovorax carolinensis TaxID=553814 RepID=A0A240UI90_9BURK|nr:cobyrinate a,c-diamide synthase [Acidovorax carolinensis]ART56811.1 cobyrinic acid a,c-diamide synthase [Acidovorax carolinensis]ART60825.1 cobyrinic acid a,c-diamide synthase [Acidovorax carolinensis]